MMDKLANYGVPASEKVLESSFGDKIDATSKANKLFVIDFKVPGSATSIIPTTPATINQLGIIEIEAFPNDYGAPTGTNTDPKMTLYRTAIAKVGDGTEDPALAEMVANSISEGGVLKIKFKKPLYSNLKAMLAFSDGRVYQVNAIAAYYVPK